jgi:hypothetical protein
MNLFDLITQFMTGLGEILWVLVEAFRNFLGGVWGG